MCLANRQTDKFTKKNKKKKERVTSSSSRYSYKFRQWWKLGEVPRGYVRFTYKWEAHLRKAERIFLPITHTTFALLDFFFFQRTPSCLLQCLIMKDARVRTFFCFEIFFSSFFFCSPAKKCVTHFASFLTHFHFTKKIEDYQLFLNLGRLWKA